jgi:hypothetical protein
MKYLLILITALIPLSLKSQSFDKKKHERHLIMGSDTSKYYYYKTKTYLIRETNGYEWRSTMPINWKIEKHITEGSTIIKLESIQTDSMTKIFNGLSGTLFLED